MADLLEPTLPTLRAPAPTWLDEDLMRRFQGRIIDVDAEVPAEWGRLLARAERRGEPVIAVDALIAATAAVHHLTVVTRNVRDMERCGVPVHCPWGEDAASQGFARGEKMGEYLSDAGRSSWGRRLWIP